LLLLHTRRPTLLLCGLLRRGSSPSGACLAYNIYIPKPSALVPGTSSSLVAPSYPPATPVASLVPLLGSKASDEVAPPLKSLACASEGVFTEVPGKYESRYSSRLRCNHIVSVCRANTLSRHRDALTVRTGAQRTRREISIGITRG
jgi:hypothetical protein